MKVSIDWLKDYVSPKASPAQMADRLTMAGLEARLLKEESPSGKAVFETEVTSNRPDWLSHVGVAQELSALFNCKLKRPESIFSVKKNKTALSLERVTVNIQDAERCRYYSCVILEGLVDQPSPQFMQDRLTACGLRPVNLVVDVTNYVLLELGQPLHAFDLDRLDGREITVRRAKKDEVLTAINGSKYVLATNDLVIADRSHAVALGGVMGGIESEVGPRTARILLESAYFQPQTVRAISRKFSLTSDSSYRFERGVNPQGVDEARDRAVYLIQKYGRVEKISRVFKAGRLSCAPKKICFPLVQIQKTLGISISSKIVKRILISLGLCVRHPKKDEWEVSVPVGRPDLTRPIDLIEEIARIYGYDRIPDTLPVGVIPEAKENQILAQEEKARQVLAGAGFFETVSFSLENQETLERLGFLEADSTTIVNPQNKELTVMRPTLLLGLLRAQRKNLDSGLTDIRLFEVAPAYGPEKDKKLPSEEVRAACLLSGRYDEGWLGGHREAGFFDMKGIAELLISSLGVRQYEFRSFQHKALEEGEALSVFTGGECIGYLGAVASEALRIFGIKQSAWVLEINLNHLMLNTAKGIRYQPPSKFPTAKRDIAMIVKDNVQCEAILNSIACEGAPLVQHVRLFDVFQGGSIPKGSRSLAFSIEYGSNNRTLTSEEVNKTHERIASCLKSFHQVQIR